MARVTRSQKIDITEDHTAITTQETSLGILAESRLLAEVTNREETSDMASTEGTSVPTRVKQLKAAYREAIGSGRKGRKPRNRKQGQLGEEQQGAVSEGYPGENEENTLEQLNAEAGHFRAPAVEEVQQDIAPPATTRRATRQQLAMKQAAEETAVIPLAEVKFLLEQYDWTQEVKLSLRDGEGTGPNNNNKAPLKSSVKTLEEVEHDYGAENDPTTADISDDDSFIEQITCRSPAKPVSRIEDSVEALDKLEEAIDALDQAALVEHIVSPEKTRGKARRGEPSVPRSSRTLQDKTRSSHDALAKATHEPISPRPKPQTPGYASMRVKSTQPKQPSSLRKSSSMTFQPASAEKNHLMEGRRKAEPATEAPAGRPISLLPPKQPTKSPKPPTRPTFELPGEAISRRLKEQRETRLAQRKANDEAVRIKPAPPPKVIKTSKPPTIPTFELPGEVISRRKREAHEARLKAQEEEERKRREFKAKPIRRSIVPDYVPRDTISSRARQSNATLESIESSQLSAAKRNSVIGARRVSQQQLNQPNTSAPRAPGPKGQLTRQSSTSSGPSLQRTVSDKEAQIQRLRAKEIYNRDARLTEDIERDRLDREAAAKRAREEAAERGRQASREWAEKQRIKRLTAAGKGAVAGNSPARQGGLKG